MIVLVLVSRVRPGFQTNTITNHDHDGTYSPRLPVLRLSLGQWLFCGFRGRYSCGAAEEFSPNHQTAPTYFGLVAQSKIQNQKSKMGRGLVCGGESHLFPLHPLAVNKLKFLDSPPFRA
jgi:hypothetical protein